MENKKPRCGWASDAKVVRVIDGDTIVVEITRTFPIRMVYENERNLEFNAPKGNTIEGKEATAFLKNLLYNDHPGEFKEIRIFIPAGENIKLTDLNSFNRLLGEVWVDEDNAAKIMLGHGHAVLKKGR